MSFNTYIWEPTYLHGATVNIFLFSTFPIGHFDID